MQKRLLCTEVLQKAPKGTTFALQGNRRAPCSGLTTPVPPPQPRPQTAPANKTPELQTRPRHPQLRGILPPTTGGSQHHFLLAQHLAAACSGGSAASAPTGTGGGAGAAPAEHRQRLGKATDPGPVPLGGGDHRGGRAHPGGVLSTPGRPPPVLRSLPSPAPTRRSSGYPALTFWMEDLPLRRSPISRIRGLESAPPAPPPGPPAPPPPPGPPEPGPPSSSASSSSSP